MKALSAMKLCQINVTGEKEKSQKNKGSVYKLYTELEGFSCSCKSPYGITERTVQEFLLSKKAWITKHLEKQNRQYVGPSSA